MTLTARHRMPLSPQGLGWRFVAALQDPAGTPLQAWFHDTSHTQVVSSVPIADQPRSGTPGPQWHISIADRSSEHPARPNAEQARLALCAFGMLEAELDSHHPGVAVHYWLPIDPSERVACECKADEIQITEPDGYTWSQRTDGGCRGCDLERAFAANALPARPCPIHVTREVSP